MDEFEMANFATAENLQGTETGNAHTEEWKVSDVTKPTQTSYFGLIPYGLLLKKVHVQLLKAASSDNL